MKNQIFPFLVVSFLVSGCSHVDGRPITTEKEGETGSNKYNVIIVCLDTLRADHLGCYGYPRDTSRNIDQLGKKGILFEKVFAQSSFTLPSHASLFTSKYVSHHGADRVERFLADKEVTLAEALKNNGYKTAAFIYNAVQLAPVYGLAQGFDTYFYGEGKNKKVSFAKTLPAALRWIKRQRENKFFVFLHSNDIHAPYQSPFENLFDPQYKGRLDKEKFSNTTSWHEKNFERTPEEIRHIIAHYDGGIKYADNFVGKLMMQLQKLSLLDKTILVVLSDHGEILADRGMRFCHGFSVHDEEVRVPLIIFHPGYKGNVSIASQVQLIDLAPTILDFLGIDGSGMPMEGKSLVDLIEGRKGGDFNEHVYAECLSGESQREGAINSQAMVRTASWKLISSSWQVDESVRKGPPRKVKMHNGAIVTIPGEDGYELYDLDNDPRETKNLINKGSEKKEKELLNKLLGNF